MLVARRMAPQERGKAVENLGCGTTVLAITGINDQPSIVAGSAAAAASITEAANITGSTAPIRPPVRRPLPSSIGNAVFPENTGQQGNDQGKKQGKKLGKNNRENVAPAGASSWRLPPLTCATPRSCHGSSSWR